MSSTVRVSGLAKSSKFGFEGSGAIFGSLFHKGDNDSGNKKVVSQGVLGGRKSSLNGVGGGVSEKFIFRLLFLDLIIPLGIFETSLSLSLSLLF